MGDRHMKIKQKTAKRLAVAAIVVVALVGMYFFGGSLTGYFVNGNGGQTGTDPIENLAKCLTEKDAVIYGLSYCGYCTQQKEMFGDSLKHIAYVECTSQQVLCQEKGIKSVPTWEIDGRFHTGLKSFEWLSEVSGCPFE